MVLAVIPFLKVYSTLLFHAVLYSFISAYGDFMVVCFVQSYNCMKLLCADFTLLQLCVVEMCQFYFRQ